MELMEAHARAVRSGGDWVARAMGVAEARLRTDPLDAVALAVKGALLTMVENDVVPQDRRDAYRRHGIEMMDAALAGTAAAPGEAEAVLYVVGVGNAMLPRGLGRDDVARRCFADLERRTDFEALPTELRLRTLVLHSCIEKARGAAEAARRRFAAARAIDLPEAAAIVTEWEARR